MKLVIRKLLSKLLWYAGVFLARVGFKRKYRNELLDYVYRQNLQQGTRTFFYCDILAYTNKNRENVDTLIADYISR